MPCIRNSLSGAECFFEVRSVEGRTLRGALKPGSYATGTCEPCQSRNAAALNKSIRVP